MTLYFLGACLAKNTTCANLILNFSLLSSDPLVPSLSTLPLKSEGNVLKEVRILQHVYLQFQSHSLENSMVHEVSVLGKILVGNFHKTLQFCGSHT